MQASHMAMQASQMAMHAPRMAMHAPRMAMQAPQMSMQASQMHTILPVAVLLWLHQVTVSQDSVLEDAREGQRDRHSLRHNTSCLHTALPCMPSNVSQQQYRQTNHLLVQASNKYKLQKGKLRLQPSRQTACSLVIECLHSCADRMRLSRQRNMHSLSVQALTCFV